MNTTSPPLPPVSAPQQRQPPTRGTMCHAFQAVHIRSTYLPTESPPYLSPVEHPRVRHRIGSLYHTRGSRTPTLFRSSPFSPSSVHCPGTQRDIVAFMRLTSRGRASQYLVPTIRHHSFLTQHFRPVLPFYFMFTPPQDPQGNTVPLGTLPMTRAITLKCSALKTSYWAAARRYRRFAPVASHPALGLRTP
jgi:hypothetical protein